MSGRCADTVPIVLRMVIGKAFFQGPYKLGFLQPVINACAIIYMIISVVRTAPLPSHLFLSAAPQLCAAPLAVQPGSMDGFTRKTNPWKHASSAADIGMDPQAACCCANKRW